MCEPAKVYSKVTRTARKEHRCCECGFKIQQGMKYEHVEGLWDEWGQFRTCQHCVAVWELVIATDRWADLCHGGLYEMDHVAWLVHLYTDESYYDSARDDYVDFLEDQKQRIEQRGA